MNAHSLKLKHVEKLTSACCRERARDYQELMSAFVLVAEKIGKEIIVCTNAAYGIPDRVYVTNISKQGKLDMDKLMQF